jgi:hypothetical protein
MVLAGAGPSSTYLDRRAQRLSITYQGSCCGGRVEEGAPNDLLQSRWKYQAEAFESFRFRKIFVK